MKQAFFVMFCLASVLLILTGCGETANRTLNSEGESSVEVIIEGGGKFPKSLVGRWKAHDHGWEFVFEPDGTISSAIIGLGHANIIPGQTRTIPTREEGGDAIFTPGLWTVYYSHETRELVVETVMDHIHFPMGEHLLEGKVRDLFMGEVSKNSKFWQAEWYAFPDYIAYTPEPKRLTRDPNEVIPIPLRFEKIEGEK